jgi:hypothetical protein
MAMLRRKTRVSSCHQLDMRIIGAGCDIDQPCQLTYSWKNLYNKEESTVGILIYPPHRIELRYNIISRTGENTYREQIIYLDTTPCNFGGQRWWFRCPECNRRCRILYHASGYTDFACRICRRLTYTSQQQRRTSSKRFLKMMEKLSGQNRAGYGGKKH